MNVRRKNIDLLRVLRVAVRKAQEKSLQMGVANVYFIDGKPHFELPNGKYSQVRPQDYFQTTPLNSSGSQSTI